MVLGRGQTPTRAGLFFVFQKPTCVNKCDANHQWLVFPWRKWISLGRVKGTGRYIVRGLVQHKLRACKTKYVAWCSCPVRGVCFVFYNMGLARDVSPTETAASHEGTKKLSSAVTGRECWGDLKGCHQIYVTKCVRVITESHTCLFHKSCQSIQPSDPRGLGADPTQ